LHNEGQPPQDQESDDPYADGNYIPRA